MRKKIHPNYDTCKVICGCGEIFETKSTKKEIKVEICSKCHPFYTGQQKILSTGQIEKFAKKYGINSAGQKIDKEEEKKEETTVTTETIN